MRCCKGLSSTRTLLVLMLRKFTIQGTESQVIDTEGSITENANIKIMDAVKVSDEKKDTCPSSSSTNRVNSPTSTSDGTQANGDGSSNQGCICRKTVVELIPPKVKSHLCSSDCVDMIVHYRTLNQLIIREKDDALSSIKSKRASLLFKSVKTCAESYNASDGEASQMTNVDKEFDLQSWTTDNARHVDSGFSRHMTGLKDLPTDFRIINGRYVAFAEDLILLRTPRRNNTYIVDMNDPETKASMACLLSKASDSESLLWYRRLGHVNIKNINRLVKQDRVRDDFSRYTWVNFLATKDETVEVLKSLNLKIEKSVSVFAARTPQQNGVVERKNRTLIVAVRTMLIYSKLPIIFWDEEVNTSNYVLNRALMVKAHNKTAYELFHGRKPLIEFFRAFGCSCTLLNTTENLAKFGVVGDECYFIGYSSSQKAYRVYNKSTKIGQESYYIDCQEANTTNTRTGPDWFYAAYIVFNNFIPPTPLVSEPYSSAEPSFFPSIQVEDEFLPFSTRITPAIADPLSVSFNNTVTSSHSEAANTARVNTSGDVSSDTTATVNSNVDQNLTNDPSVNSDSDSDNNVDSIIPDENLTNLPAHVEDLVVQGFAQEEGIDYEEVFSPMACLEAIRIFLAYACFKNFKVYQMDVKSAFLYEKVKEEVYVCLPPGFEDPDYPSRVYKLDKALYGLHQAPMAWYDTLSSYLLQNGFERGNIDMNLFKKKIRKDIMLVQIYVDDIIFGSTDEKLCRDFENVMEV
ncbi:hypothetical protein L1987_06649 [Smallanthus sonchifolius]|uniref:Uncharacterized protein n=1 Tax=Smallanthus sonchifolius TaxID=185202 RepID=A0ACB9JYX8_9ASTR|nr:hypothetical protein L1987_06649 [Smallanthus sonchifolius]